MNWKSTDDDVSGYEDVVEESALNAALILLYSADFYDPVRSLPYWDAVAFYCAKREHHEQKDIEYCLITTYCRAQAYHKAGDETKCDQILETIIDSKEYEQLYNNWRLTHHTTDYGDQLYEIYESVCGIE